MWTKEQQDKYNKEYYQKNKEALKKDASNYFNANKETVLVKQKQYYIKNKDSCQATHAKYRNKHKKEAAKYAKEYYIKNNDKLKKYKKQYQQVNKKRLREKRESFKTRYSYAKSKAKCRQIQFLLSFDEYVAIIQCGICHYCGLGIEKVGSGLDRKNNERFYSIDNAVSCCRRCNVTFNNYYNYEEKLLLANTIKNIDHQRINATMKEGE